MSNKAILYARYSPRPLEKTQAETLDIQLERMRAYVRFAELDPEPVELRDERTSGGKSLQSRTVGKLLLDHLATGVYGHVVVCKLDRLFRSVVDCRQTVDAWDKQGIALHILDLGGSTLNSQTAMGRMFLGITAVFAEFERDQTASRTREAIRHYQANGRRMSDRIPYGWREDPDSVPNKRGRPTGIIEHPHEQKIIERIRAERDKGRGLREIARLLMGEGITCRGEQWYHQTIRTILARKNGLE